MKISKSTQAPLPGESANALRLCYRILLEDEPDPKERELIGYHAEDLIRRGLWPKYFETESVARLFFHRDREKAARFLELLKADHPGVNHFTATSLAAWQRCPALPADSPLVHWLPAWMQGLQPLATPKKETRKPNPSVDWQHDARRIADEEFDRDTKLGTRDSLEGYAGRVETIMQSHEIHGLRGRLSGGYIKRNALQGPQWWQKKKK